MASSPQVTAVEAALSEPEASAVGAGPEGADPEVDGHGSLEHSSPHL